MSPRSSDYEEITIDPTCSWKPVPVKPDVHVKEEPDGPVLKRCRTVSPAHVLMPSVMEMIAALGPGAAPFAPLQPPSAPAPGDYPGQGEYGGPGPGTWMAAGKRSVLFRPVKCHRAGPVPGGPAWGRGCRWAVAGPTLPGAAEQGPSVGTLLGPGPL